MVSKKFNMTESIIKILKKLKNNIEKYSVVCNYYKDGESCLTEILADIVYTKHNTKFYICFYKDNITIINDRGIKIVSPYIDEIRKLECFKLVVEIYQNCKNILSRQIREFADEIN